MIRRNAWKKGMAALAGFAMITTLLPSVSSPLTVQAWNDSSGSTGSSLKTRNINLVTIETTGSSVASSIPGIDKPDTITATTGEAEWSGSHVYFGHYPEGDSRGSDQAVDFRVLDAGSGTMLLDADTVFGIKGKDDIPAYLETLRSSVFATEEQNAIKKTAIDAGTDSTLVSAVGTGIGDPAAGSGSSTGSLSNAVYTNPEVESKDLFLLSVADLMQSDYGYAITKESDDANKRLRKKINDTDGAKDWWIRSQKKNPSGDSGQYVSTGASVSSEGVVGSAGGEVYVSPALNLDMSKIFFTHAVQLDKTKGFAATALTYTNSSGAETQYENEKKWCLTLNDGNEAPFTVGSFSDTSFTEGQQLQIPITISNPLAADKDYTQISAMLTGNTSHAVIAYGKVCGWSELLELTEVEKAEQSGTLASISRNLEVVIPDDFTKAQTTDSNGGTATVDESYALYLFAEKITSGQLCDYASNRQTVFSAGSITETAKPKLPADTGNTPDITIQYTGNEKTGTGKVQIQAENQAQGIQYNKNKFLIKAAKNDTEWETIDFCTVSDVGVTGENGYADLTITETYTDNLNTVQKVALFYKDTKLGELRIDREYEPVITWKDETLSRQYTGQSLPIGDANIVVAGQTLATVTNGQIDSGSAQTANVTFTYYTQYDADNSGSRVKTFVNDSTKSGTAPVEIGDYTLEISVAAGSMAGSVSYKETSNTATVHVLPKSLDVRVKDQSCNVNGMIASTWSRTDTDADGYKPLIDIDSSALCQGDYVQNVKLELAAGSSTSQAGQGTIECKELKIYNNNNDVTAHYSPKYTSGNLSVSDKITITPQDQTWQCGTDNLTTYNVSNLFAVVPTNAACKYELVNTGTTGTGTLTESGVLSVTKTGIFEVKVTASASSYQGATATATLTVTKGTGYADITVGTDGKITYGENISVSIETSNTGVDPTYWYKKATETEYTQNKPTQVGTYHMKASFPATDAYEACEKVVEFHIVPRTLTLTPNEQTIPYSGTIAQGLGQVTVQGLASGEQLSKVQLVQNGADVTGNGTTAWIAIQTDSVQIEKADHTAVSLSNYNITYNTGNLNITPLSFEGLVSAGDVAGEYDGSVRKITVQLDPEIQNGTTVVYRDVTVQTNDVYKAECPEFLNAGTYTVEYKVTRTGYTDLIDCAKITIAKKPVTMTPKEQLVKWGHSLTLSSDNGNLNVGISPALASGDQLTGITFTPKSGTELTGDTRTGITLSNAKITRNDTSGTADVTDNYEITYQSADSVLTVEHDEELKPVSMTASMSKVFYKTTDEWELENNLKAEVAYQDGYTAEIAYSTEANSLWKELDFQTEGVDIRKTGAQTLTIRCRGVKSGTDTEEIKEFTIPVRIYEPVKVQTQPKDQSITAGNTVQFSVEASGTEIDTVRITYQWQKSTDGGFGWEDIPEAVGKVYTTDELNVEDTGTKYRCKVTNGESTALTTVISDAAVVTINPIAVGHTSVNDVTAVYDGSAVDVTRCFILDSNAGTPHYTLVEEPGTMTGEGELDDSTGELTVHKTGSFRIKVETDKKGNYDKGHAEAVLTVRNGTITYSGVEGYTGIYDGKAHGITVNGVVPSDAELTYCTEAGGTHSAEEPVFTEAGEYTVYYRIAKDNYDAVTGSVVVKIDKRTLVFTPKDQTIAAGGSLDPDAYTYTGTLADADEINNVTFKTVPEDYTRIYSDGQIRVGQVRITNSDRGDVTGNYVVQYAESPARLKIVHNPGLAPDRIKTTAKDGQKIYKTTDYTAGQTVDVEKDFVVNAYYEDGFEQAVDTYTTNAEQIDMTKEGEKELQIAYTENGKTVTTQAVLTVKAPPTWEQELSDVTIKAGNAVVLTVQAQGSDSLVYQWAERDADDGEWKEIAGAQEMSYTTPAFKVSSSGKQYRCTVSNDWGQAVTSCAVTVEAIPVTITGTDTAAEYSDDMVPIRINDYFEVDDTAGERTYELEIRENGAGTLSAGDDPELTVTRPGAFVITLKTAAKDDIYEAASKTITVTVKKGVIPYKAAGFTGVYDAKPHQIEVNPGTLTGNREDSVIRGVEITYSLDEGEDKVYSADDPEFTDAGEYTVFYKLEKENYETVTGFQTVKITQRPVTIKAENQTIAWGHEIAKDESAYTISGDGLADGHWIEKIGVTQSTTQLTENGKIEVSGAKIIQILSGIAADPSEADVTKNYDITYEDGSLTILHDESLAPESITAVRAVTTYKIGTEMTEEDLEKEITVTAEYEDGFQKEITDGFEADASHVNMEGEGVYPIEISYTENGKTCKTVVEITVMIPPSVKADPADAQVTVLQPAVFEVEAEGTGLSCQWYVKLAADGDWIKAAGATKPVFRIDAAGLEQDGYQYRCEITNAVGTVTSKAAVLSVDPIAVTNQAVKDSVTVRYDEIDGKGIDMSEYFALGEDAGGVTYTWQKEGTGETFSQTESTLMLTETGTYEVALTTAAHGNYAAADPVTVTLTVQNGRIQYEAAGETVIYDGASHSIDLDVESPDSTVVTYYSTQLQEGTGTETETGAENEIEDRTDSEAQEASYTAGKPEFVNVGTYIVYYRIEKPNYETAEGSGQIVITKREITLAPEAQTILSGGRLDGSKYAVKEGTLAAGDSIAELTFKAVPEGSAADAVIFTKESEPFAKVGSGSITVSSAGEGNATIVNKKEEDVTANYKITYGDSAAYTVEHDSSLEPVGVTAEKEKILYTTAEKLNLDDITVTVSYEDGYSRTVDGYTVDTDAIDLTKTGRQTFTVSYTENETTVTDSITLTIEAAPAVTKQPADANVYVGDSAEFIVTADGTKPLTYQWYCSNGDGWKKIEDATKNTYQTSRLTLNENGSKYKCRITNPHGEVETREAVLTVEQIPVQNEGRDASVDYSNVKDTAIDVSKYFMIDQNAGQAVYTWENADEDSALFEGSMLTVKKSGSYVIGLTTADNGKYAAGQEVTVTLTIVDGAIESRAEDVKATYDGKPHSPQVIVTEPEGAVITYYSVKAEETGAGTQAAAYTSAKPEFTDAGRYIVYYRIEKPNYSTAEGSVQVVIEKRKLEIRAEEQTILTGGMLDMSQYSVTDGTLAEGDVITEIGFTAEPDDFIKTGTGKISIYGSKITTEDGTKEVTENYEISYVPGIYTVVPVTFMQNGLIYTVLDTTDGTKTVSVKAEDTVLGGRLEIPKAVTENEEAYTVTELAESAFCGCEQLNELIIPDTITAIGKDALKDTSLVTLTIPASVKKIDSAALSGCGQLATIVFEGKTAPKIADNALEGTSENLKIIVPSGASGYNGIKAFSGRMVAVKETEKPDTTEQPTTEGTTEQPSTERITKQPSTERPVSEQSVTESSSQEVAEVTQKQKQENAVVMNNKTSAKWSGSTVTLKWGKVEGAEGYDVYAALDGKSYKGVEVSVSGGSRTSAKLSKVNGKKLSAKNIYKIRVKAYRIVSGTKEYIATGQDMCIVGSKHEKYTNAKSIKATKSAYKLKKGKTAQIKASITKQDKGKKLLPSRYGKSLKYTSANEKIATVSAKGKIKARGKGTCYIYVTALNGVNKKIKVTVK